MSLYLPVLSSMLPDYTYLCAASQLKAPDKPRRRRRKSGIPLRLRLLRHHQHASQSADLPRSYEVALLVWRAAYAWRHDPIHEMILRLREFKTVEKKVPHVDTPVDNNLSFPVTPENRLQAHPQAPNWPAVAQASPSHLPRASRAAARSLEPIPIVRPKDLSPASWWRSGHEDDGDAHATDEADSTAAMYIQVLKPYYGDILRRRVIPMDVDHTPRAAEDDRPFLDMRTSGVPNAFEAFPGQPVVYPPPRTPHVFHRPVIPHGPSNVVWLPPASHANPPLPETRSDSLQGSAVDGRRPQSSNAAPGDFEPTNGIDGGVARVSPQYPGERRPSEDQPRIEMPASEVQGGIEASSGNRVFYPPPRTPTVLHIPVIPGPSRQAMVMHPPASVESQFPPEAHEHGAHAEGSAAYRGRRMRMSSASASFGSTSSVEDVAPLPSPPQHPDGTRYHVMGQVGKGASGRVLAAATSAGELVALKVMHKPTLAKSGDVPKTLYMERCLMRYAAQRNLDTLLHLKAAWEQEEYVYLAMPLCAEDLLGPIRRAAMYGGMHAIPETEKKLLCAEMVLALIDLQKFQTIHGDIKPDNFLITKTGRVVLSDFGLVQRPTLSDVERATPFNFEEWDAPQTYGTPGYFSPEALCRFRPGRRLPLTCQADVFSLGLVFAELFWERPSPLWDTMPDAPEDRSIDAIAWQTMDDFERQAARMMTDGLSKLHDDRALKDKRGRDLVIWMLHPDPKQRPRPHQILCHPYLSELDIAAVYEGRILHASRPRFLESLKPGTFSQFVRATSYREENASQLNLESFTYPSPLPSGSCLLRPPGLRSPVHRAQVPPHARPPHP
ncbi:kinase-like protein [Trametes sanguinea]|nr:kinase-like protein [Trametes sanguinea]